MTHSEFSRVWSACADAEYVNQLDANCVFAFLRNLHEDAFISAVNTCSLCDEEHGQQGAPYKVIKL